jgi:hypothetical protein
VFLPLLCKQGVRGFLLPPRRTRDKLLPSRPPFLSHHSVVAATGDSKPLLAICFACSIFIFPVLLFRDKLLPSTSTNRFDCTGVQSWRTGVLLHRPDLVKNLRRYEVGGVPKCLMKCCRSVAAVCQPTASATWSMLSSVCSRRRWAASSRRCVSHWCGVVPVCRRNCLANVRGDMAARLAKSSTDNWPFRFDSIYGPLGGDPYHKLE